MNQKNKDFIEFLTKSGVNFFLKNKPNNYYENKGLINNSKKQEAIQLNLSEINSLEKLFDYIKSSDNCLLKETAKSTVLSDGNPNSSLMIIGEAPGKEEDETGLPFVGKAGQLLNKMLLSINIDRKDVYITNVVPWRPPNNRTPLDNEIMQCLPFLQRHIEIVKPKIILLLGATAAKAILSTTLSISKLRSSWHSYSTINMKKSINSLVSYHPAFLLRSPNYKKEAWDDLKMLKKKINDENI